MLFVFVLKKSSVFLSGVGDPALFASSPIPGRFYFERYFARKIPKLQKPATYSALNLCFHEL